MRILISGSKRICDTSVKGHGASDLFFVYSTQKGIAMFSVQRIPTRYRLVRPYLGLIVLIVLTSFESAYAAVVAYEDFDYAPGTSLAGLNGGSGFTGPWQQAVPTQSQQVEMSPGSLNYPGLVTQGNRATAPVFYSDVAQFTRQLNFSLTPSQSNPQVTQYISFLVRPDGALGQGADGGVFGLAFDQSGFDHLQGRPVKDVFAGKSGVPNTTYYAHQRLTYAQNGLSGEAQQVSPVSINPGETALLVLEVESNHSSAISDKFKLYVNPIPGQHRPPTQLVEQLIATPEGLSIFSSDAFSIDEIRVGDTYEDVTPALPGSQQLVSVDFDVNGSRFIGDASPQTNNAIDYFLGQPGIWNSVDVTNTASRAVVNSDPPPVLNPRWRSKSCPALGFYTGNNELTTVGFEYNTNGDLIGSGQGNGDDLRGDYLQASSAIPVAWEINGLVPGREYEFRFFGEHDGQQPVSPSEFYVAGMMNAVPLDSEYDANFRNMADADGKIEGTHGSGTWSGFQVHGNFFFRAGDENCDGVVNIQDVIEATRDPGETVDVTPPNYDIVREETIDGYAESVAVTFLSWIDGGTEDRDQLASDLTEILREIDTRYDAGEIKFESETLLYAFQEGYYGLEEYGFSHGDDSANPVPEPANLIVVLGILAIHVRRLAGAKSNRL